MSETELSNRQAIRLEFCKLKLERARLRSEVIKWIVIAIGAVASFIVLDYGKLQLERLRLAADNQFRFIDAYSKAIEAPEPEVWKRKLGVLELAVADDRFQKWLEKQRAYVDEFAALEALYRETLKTASQLVDPTMLNDQERIKARRRFEQLYWADLPFAGESPDVASGMVAFRKDLVAAEKTPTDAEAWTGLNSFLIQLSETLKEATRKSSRPAQGKANP